MDFDTLGFSIVSDIHIKAMKNRNVLCTCDQFFKQDYTETIISNHPQKLRLWVINDRRGLNMRVISFSYNCVPQNKGTRFD